MLKSKNLILIAILLLGLGLRIFKFGDVPPSLNWDEASLGYNAYSILKTGKDEWGRSFPLTFEAFGDFKLPVYIYLDVPFVALFGLNELGVRFPSLIAGIFSVLLVYLISKKLFKNENLSLIAALFMAISPWEVFLSRVGLEANLALGLFLAAFYLFLIGLERRKWLIFSSLLFGLTMFTYNSARVFVPLFLIGIVVLYRVKLKSLKNKLILPLLIILFFMGVAGYFAFFQDSASRYYWVTIVDQGAINYLNEARANSTFPPFLTNLIYNRYSYFIFNAIKNYFSHFSLGFLFFEGGSNHQFSVPNLGLMYVVEIPLLILGIVNLFKRKLSGWVILMWVLIAPIPAAITRESPHVLRSIFMLGGLQIIVAAGIVYLIQLVLDQKKIVAEALVIILVALFSLNFGFYFYRYFYVYPIEESFAWQYGMKQANQYLKENGLLSKDKIFVTKKYGEPHIFYLFYYQYPPANYQNNFTLERYEKTNWRWVDRLDNIYFVDDFDIKDRTSGEKGAILVTSPLNYPLNSKILDTIYFKDGSRALDIVEIE